MPDLAVEAILKQGQRDFGAGNDFMRLHTDHGHAVRDAYLAGHSDGSLGLASREDAIHAWQRSRPRIALERNPPGANIIGRLIVSTDPRTLGREQWKIVGIHQSDAWITSLGREHPIDLIVKLDTCRGVI